MAHDVFVSYSKQDKATADAIVARLEQDGSRCWIAPRDILPGTSWGEAIVDAIGVSRVMVLVLSADSNRSRQVVREVQRAVAGDVIVLPFRIDPADPTGAMAYFLGTEHWLDALTPPLERHIERLSQTVRLPLAREPVPRESLDQPPATLGRPHHRPWRVATLAGSTVIVGLAVLAAILVAGPFGRGGPTPTPVPSVAVPPVALAQVGRFVPYDIDLTDQEGPAPISGFDIDGTLLAYANGPDGVTRMSIGEPAAPRPMEAFNIVEARVVALAGDHLAAVTDAEALDVTVWKEDGTGAVGLPMETDDVVDLSDIEAHDGFVYVSTHDYVASIDITDPSRPQLGFEWRSPDRTGNPAGVHVAGAVLYVAAGWDGLYLFSVADPEAVVLLGHWTSPAWVIDVTVEGATAYVTLGETGVAALDVSDPAAPMLLGSVSVPGFANVIDAADGIAYVGWSGSSGSLGGIAIVDMADPLAPVLVDTVGRFASLTHLELGNGHLYVSDEGEGLVVFGITAAG